MKLKPEIEAFCQDLENELGQISKERIEKLIQLSYYISNKYKKYQTPKLVVICTHNSRRSHIGQTWLAVGSNYFQLPEIQSFSGGTEATAFNLRAVKAFQRIGFQISTEDENVEIQFMKLSGNKK